MPPDLTVSAHAGDPHLRSVAPHVRLADHASIYRVTVAVFGKAGITEVKAGTRFLRHNAASRMLRAAVSLPTISAVLGHADPESTSRYMKSRVLRLTSENRRVSSGRGTGIGPHARSLMPSDLQVHATSPPDA